MRAIRTVGSKLALASLVTILAFGISSDVEGGTFVSIQIEDPPNHGFHDPAPYHDDSGGSAATLGAARLAALRAAVALWANQIDSPVEIEIAARFEPLGGDAFSGRLGLGGPESMYRDFTGAPQSSTWYPSALANKLAGMDLDGGTASEIQLVFNAEVDGPGVLGSSKFYYGVDGNPPPGDISFLHVALHEIGHGLGFTSVISRSTGAKLLGLDDIFLTWVERAGAVPPDLSSMTDSERLAALRAEGELRWTGPAVTAAAPELPLAEGVDADGRVQLHAPQTISINSMVHFSSSVEPDELMEPFWRPALDLTLSRALLEDLGWGAAADCRETGVPSRSTAPGVYRAGTWILDTDASRSFTSGVDAVFGYGQGGDIPVVGDWDGDGADEVGLYRNGTWILDTDGSRSFTAGVDAVFGYGLAMDVPVVGDWDGDGADEVGVFRDGWWTLDTDGSRSFTSGVDAGFGFGLSTDRPRVGDWDGDGADEVGLYRDGWWILDSDGSRSFTAGVDAGFTYGNSTDLGVVGDWNGDGADEVGVFRAGWWILDIDGSRSFTSGVDPGFRFGNGTDQPAAGAW
ncbi:MAG: hypothetical protein AAF481_19915 [Acidobacteriota bacterium]